jgi:hypothetical protein
LFIYRICGRIMRERPRMALLTLHDSLLTSSKADLDYIVGVILDEFRKLGVTPTLKRKAHAPNGDLR